MLPTTNRCAQIPSRARIARAFRRTSDSDSDRDSDRDRGSDSVSVGPGMVTESGHGHPARGRSTDRGVAGHLVLRCTGLPSRAALVAPSLRLAALRWRVAFVLLGRSRPPSGVSTACLVAVTRFSVSRVREPGTAERESLRLRPQGDRRMPGTRPSCPWRQTSPARPPVRDVSCSVEVVILVPRGCARRAATLGFAATDPAAVAETSPPRRTHLRCSDGQTKLGGDPSTRKLARGDMGARYEGAASSVSDPVSGAMPGCRDRTGLGAVRCRSRCR
jgi:hypothetical protein